MNYCASKYVYSRVDIVKMTVIYIIGILLISIKDMVLTNEIYLRTITNGLHYTAGCGIIDCSIRIDDCYIRVFRLLHLGGLLLRLGAMAFPPPTEKLKEFHIMTVHMHGRHVA